ncbi:hypothetical protein ACHMW6_06300 [Pseudoduganella sp. UC29_106]|uniref:hypothetical protein n=1 Tax=Pseudoduganella sp. UC29_106 TaxID=3374553 RepID=UPI0037579A8B
MKREYWYVVWLAFLFVVAVGGWTYTFTEKTECEARGGMYLRGIWGAPKCYDVRGTK